MKTKNIILIGSLLVGLIFSGCEKVLMKDNPSAISPKVVWTDQNAANAYINEVMANLMPQFSTHDGRNSDEASSAGAAGNMMPAVLKGTAQIDEWNNWSYGDIYKINVLLSEIDGGTLDESFKNKIKGQAYFWRAWAYFSMVKYYGGVPLILKPQDPQSGNELFLPRNKTSECIAQITSDLDQAIAMLPSSWGSSDLGRIDKNGAIGFKGRVLLYYASPQFNPQNDAARWQKAYDANKAAIETCTASGKGLFSSFANIWYDNSNNETIIQRQYKYPEQTYTEDSNRPNRFTTMGFGWDLPSLEMANAFPMIDGSPYDSTKLGIAQYFKDRDPRFYATIVYNGSDYAIKDLIALGAYMWTYHKLGVASFEGSLFSSTSFYRNKAIDKSLDANTAPFAANVPWIEMRYAEVLMNYGEAANEIGKPAEALDVLYQIRARAGILPGLDNKYGIKATTQAEIRTAFMNERFIEFAFENMRFWDLRRLRRFDVLNNMQYHHGLYITLKDGFPVPLAKEDITTIYNQFSYEIRVIDPQKINCLDQYYFFAIPGGIIAQNSKLEQTQGWNNGTFDPLQ